MTYIHTDHLNTPRLGTNDTQTLVWQYQSQAFGQGKADKDPDKNGINVNIRLRFPGQYRDGESGLYYNYFRYYDPQTGRYITSDPIGLRGGLNSYGYVGGNPLYWIDPFGLDVWPAQGPVTSGFGDRSSPTGGGDEFHGAVDIANPNGASVCARKSGRVFRVRQNSNGRANTVTIQYDDGTAGSYSHLTSTLSVGERIREGQAVGVTDQSGRSTGGHLHYEYYRPGVSGPVDPLQELQGADPYPDCGCQ